MKVKFYGRLADVMGSELELDVDYGCTVEGLRRFIAKERAGEMLLDGKVRACIHDSIVPDARRIEPGDCVEFFPPVSGG